MATDTRVLVLIGAGSAVFTRGLLADLIGAEDLGAWEIRLVDVDTETLSIAARPGRADGGRARRGRQHPRLRSHRPARRPRRRRLHRHLRRRRRATRMAARPRDRAEARHLPAGRRLDHARRHLTAPAHDARARRDRAGHRRARARRVLLQLLQPDDRECAGHPPADGPRCRRPLPRHAPHPARARPAHRRALRAHLDAVRGDQPPDVHLRLPHRRQGCVAAHPRACAARTRRGAGPRRHRQHLLREADGLAQPVRVGALRPLRRVRGRRRPARRGVLPRAVLRRATTTARSSASTRSRCPRSWSGARTATRGCGARRSGEEAARPVDLRTLGR